MKTSLGPCTLPSIAATVLALALSIAAPGCGGGGLSGVYAAQALEGEEDAMTIEFLPNNQAKLGISGAMGFGFQFTGTYAIDGDRVTIKGPEGEEEDEVVLTIKGGTLEGEVLGEQITFHKK